MTTGLTRAAAPLGLILALGISAAASATPIQYIFTGTGSGTLGTTSFTDAAFTITQQSDTSAATSCVAPCNASIDATTADISIAGLGDYAFTTGTRAFVNLAGFVGLSRAGLGGADLFEVNATAGSGYDLTTAAGPIFSTVDSPSWLVQWGGSNPEVDTTAGAITFADNFSVIGSFEAIGGNVSVPEPGTLSLLALGLIGVALAQRRKVS